MLFYLLLLFTVVPLVEFSLLYAIGERIGLLPTIALVIVTGVLGAALARAQGVATLWRIREQSARGRMPADALFDGVLILLAGAVLITPGVLTDALGFGLLIPPVRAAIKRGLRRWFAKHVRVEAAVVEAGWSPGGPPEDNVVDGRAVSERVVDVRVVDPEKDAC